MTKKKVQEDGNELEAATQGDKNNKKKGDSIEEKNKKKKQDIKEKEEEKKEEETLIKQQKLSKLPQKNLAGKHAEHEASCHVALIIVDVINDLDFEGIIL